MRPSGVKIQTIKGTRFLTSLDCESESRMASKTSKNKMLTRDCKRRVDVISKKIKELGEMGVPAAFCYIAPWSGGVFMVGDSRITDVYRGSSKNLLQRLAQDNASQPDSQPAKHICLPKLPGPLKELNGPMLKSMVTAIAKDMRFSWSGERPDFWPEDIPFTNPRQVPENFQGSWSSALKKIISAAYLSCGLDPDQWVEDDETPPGQEPELSSTLLSPISSTPPKTATNKLEE